VSMVVSAEGRGRPVFADVPNALDQYVVAVEANRRIKWAAKGHRTREPIHALRASRDRKIGKGS